MVDESTGLISVQQSHQVSQGAQRAEKPDEKKNVNIVLQSMHRSSKEI
jgi:hypothetical protein